jgi:hypothetical protein
MPVHALGIQVNQFARHVEVARPHELITKSVAKSQTIMFQCAMKWENRYSSTFSQLLLGM